MLTGSLHFPERSHGTVLGSNGAGFCSRTPLGPMHFKFHFFGVLNLEWKAAQMDSKH